MITPSGRKVAQAEEERKKREKTLLIVDTYFSDSAHKPLGPIFYVTFHILFKIVLLSKYL